ncbi:MAG: oligoendopeptidase F [Spirochaetes bacterium]|nr:oligoendopeptidase F [Spirochaetota bacterium]
MDKKIPARTEVAAWDRWDLSALFPDETDWGKGLKSLETMGGNTAALAASFKPEEICFLKTLRAYSVYLQLDERLGYYAHLRSTEDEGDSDSRGRYARYIGVSTAGQAAWAWLAPTIQTMPESFTQGCIAKPAFADYAVFLAKLLRFKPHILSEKEERLLALQTEANQTSQETFGVLTNVDFNFGSIGTTEGARPLSQSTFPSFMRNKDRSLRRKAYRQFYAVYEKHKNALASLYAGSVKLDKYQAQARAYVSARDQALFPDKVPGAVYDNLVSTIGENLDVLHDYYRLRKQVLGLRELRHYDVYVPLVELKEGRRSYDQAVEIVTSALAPLGKEYVATLGAGLKDGWVDRYENKGKRSGAFSAGSFSGEPYILLNYKEDMLKDVFTMAHEGGHSMHSWYSARSNPFLSYNYTIFEAEVASTFNEQLVFAYLYDKSGTDEEKAYLLSSRIDDCIGTLFRQTMFAEYEDRTHAMIEAGEPLTVDSLRSEYGKLLRKYFGPTLVFEEVSDLESLRIPHFYNAFYVYKYATGISAARALAIKVLGGGKAEREAYFDFLRSGGSRFPIEALKAAGVDMASPEPVRLACAGFARDVTALKGLLGR